MIHVCRRSHAKLSHPVERPTGAGLREMPEEDETELGREAEQSLEKASKAR
jgi:hypothetical protein